MELVVFQPIRRRRTRGNFSKKCTSRRPTVHLAAPKTVPRDVGRVTRVTLFQFPRLACWTRFRAETAVAELRERKNVVRITLEVSTSLALRVGLWSGIDRPQEPRTVFKFQSVGRKPLVYNNSPIAPLHQGSLGSNSILRTNRFHIIIDDTSIVWFIHFRSPLRTISHLSSIISGLGR